MTSARAGARGRRRLGARIPATPCSSVSFAPSLRGFSVRGRRRLGARIPAKPYSSVSFAPSLRGFSVRGRRGLGARIPASPCSSVSFAPSLRGFSVRAADSVGQRPAAADLVHESPQTLVLPSPLHQVFGYFRPAAAVTFSKSKVDKRAIMLYHSICQLLQQTS